MRLPSYINLFDDPVNEGKHAGQINYQRVNDLLSEFEANEIGEIMAAGFIYEIYGIELDLDDPETKELFPCLQDRACKTQYRQLLTDFDVNAKSYKDRSNKGRQAALIRWHGKGGSVTQEQKPELETEPAPEIIQNAEPEQTAVEPMTDRELSKYYVKLRTEYPDFEDFRTEVIRRLNDKEITVQDKFKLIELARK